MFETISKALCATDFSEDCSWWFAYQVEREFTVVPYETAAILISHSFTAWSGGNIMPAFPKAVVIFSRGGVSALDTYSW